MRLIKLGFLELIHRPTYLATFATIYGIGKIKARRLNNFLLHLPNLRCTEQNIKDLVQKPLGRNMFTQLFIGKRVRLFNALRLQSKLVIFTYFGLRLFQNLPIKGQRTKCNAGTPRRLNPYLSLKIEWKIYPELKIEYKKLELKHNSRFDELTAFNQSLVQEQKMKKTEKKLKKKIANQQYMKEQKIQMKNNVVKNK